MPQLAQQDLHHREGSMSAEMKTCEHEPHWRAPEMQATSDPTSSVSIGFESDHAHGQSTTAAHTTMFKHGPLNKERKEFRLFRLVQASSDHVSVELENFIIEEAPPYHAISYCWGSQELMPSITLNGSLFQIGQNLYDLLAVRREKIEGLYLWADQICIDQHVATERNHQVSQMGEIYSKADAVLVWLGLHETASDAVSELSRVFAQVDGSVEAVEPQDFHLNFYPHTTLPGRTPDGIVRLLRDPYWRRHWVIQEILLARKFYILYDRHEVLWEMFKVLLYKCSYSIRENYEFIAEHLRTLIQVHLTYHKGISSTIFSLLDLCHRSRCSDPRDKVYGLQNLFSEDLRVPVDYSREPRDVFLDAATTYLVRLPVEDNHRVWDRLCYLSMAMGIVGGPGQIPPSVPDACVEQVRELQESIAADPSKEDHVKGVIRQLVAEAVFRKKYET